MTNSNPLVHQGHCCAIHGCKYGHEDCPVQTQQIQQSYPCEDCGPDPEPEFSEEAALPYGCPTCGSEDVVFVGERSTLHNKCKVCGCLGPWEEFRGHKTKEDLGPWFVNAGGLQGPYLTKRKAYESAASILIETELKSFADSLWHNTKNHIRVMILGGLNTESAEKEVASQKEQVLKVLGHAMVEEFEQCVETWNKLMGDQCVKVERHDYIKFSRIDFSGVPAMIKRLKDET